MHAIGATSTAVARVAFPLLFAALCAGSAAAEVLEINTRPGVTQPAALLAPDKPRAVALLFAGGNGGLTFAPDGEPATFKANFLIRSRELFKNSGLAVALVGAPSDRGAPEFLSDAFRLSAEHASDVAALVQHLRQRFAAPIWLIGTSRGTLSAANAGLRLGRIIDGVVLTSGMTSVADLEIDRFEVPVLLVHHTRDTCAVTDYRDLRRLRSKLAAPRTELLTFSGGRSEGPPCEAFAYHGFNGIEREVVAAIANWIARP